MLEVWLNYKDESGEAKRVLVEGEKFAIGRTPDNDLQIPLGNLSRQHVRMERFGDIVMLVECGSSNGTTINDEKVTDPVPLKNGDKINLGEVIEIEVEFVSDKPQGGKGGGNADDNAADGNAEPSAPATSKTKAATADSSSGGYGFLLLIPVFGIILLLFLGVVAFVISRPKEPEIAVKNENYTYKSDIDDDDELPNNDNKKTPEKVETPTPANNSTNNTVNNSGGTTTTVTPINQPDNDTPSTPKVSEEGQKIELASALFLRRIAQNDPRAFLTDKKISVLNTKINQFKGSSNLAENIRNAKKNSSQIVSMAQTKNLKPLFLANAALTKLGNQRGDVVATAQSMVEVLDNLSIVIGNEMADDNLLVIAAFNQGVANENLKLRDMMAKLTKEFPNATPAQIRTIWFLKDNKKITDEEFEFALRFLAIGTITQNPKDFNVQAEALIF